MLYVALGLSVLALGLSWVLMRKYQNLKERIAQVNSKLYHTNRDWQEKHAQIQQELTRLNYEILNAQGKLKVSGEMTIDELSYIHPQSADVLAQYHIGGCSSCGVEGHERLDLAAARNGQPLEAILLSLNTLLDESRTNNSGLVNTDRLQKPNVQLEF